MLHRTIKVAGFHVYATDGSIGHVDDFLFDESTWKIRYLVIDTSNWIGGKTVLVSSTVITAVNPVEKRITVSLTREQIKEGPSMNDADIPTAEMLPTIWMII